MLPRWLWRIRSPNKSMNIMCKLLILLISSAFTFLEAVVAAIPSSTWYPSIINHDGLLEKRHQWGGGSSILERRNSNMQRELLYRRGGSDEVDIDVSTQYADSQTNSNTSVNNNTTSSSTSSSSSSSIVSSLTVGTPLLYSACSIQGQRPHMEDEYFVEDTSSFASVFDGHGGGRVSKYLRQNLYANFQAALPTSASMFIDDADDDIEALSEISIRDADVQSLIVASALEAAFEKVDNEVGSISHWSFQGSTALAVVIHENTMNESRYITVANVGDSRAVISRNGKAIDLTKDHKPNDKFERERIESLGGSVDWCGQVDDNGNPIESTGCYRINGNLALSRAIGDRSERPWVTNTADISHYLIDEENDEFVVLATDGLYDVMTSQDIVLFVNDMLESTPHPDSRRHEIQSNMAKYVVDEAIKRGTNDNVTVLIVWISKKDTE